MRNRVLLVGLVALALGSRAAHAVNNEGTPQSFFHRYRVFGDAVRTGNVLVLPGGGTGEVVNQFPLMSSTAGISGVPSDASVQAAFLFWSASLKNDEATWPGPTMPDDTADFRTPDGVLHGSILGNCAPELTTDDGHFYYCSAEVTSIVAALASPNGNYTVSGVDYDYGHVMMPGSAVCDPNDPHCQAKYANWSLMVVYAAPSVGTQRDIILYNGFTHFDEQVLSGGVFSPGVGPATPIQVPPDGFQIPNPPNVQIAYYAMEGDPQLGVPPETQECPTCFDSFYFYSNGVQHPLGNAGPPNAIGNVMDSQPSPGAFGGLDLDEFDISSFVSPGNVPPGGASPFAFQPRSGDGLFTSDDSNFGGGESFFIGWVMFKVNRLAPNFTNTATSKSVDPTQAAAGETLFYTINLLNNGAVAATNVQLADVIPAGESFIAGSVRVDGVACNPPQCTFSGGDLTVHFASIPPAPAAGSSHTVTFRGAVNGNVMQGQQICNSAQLTFAETQGAQTIGPACTTVQSPTLGTPTKREIDLGPGAVPQPGDTLQFTITIPKSSTPAVNSISLRDDLPPFLRLIPASVVAPAGAQVTAQSTGGANGTGFLQVDNIVIPANVASVTVTFSAHLFTEAEFNAAGVPSSGINNRQICNQGAVSAPFLPSPLQTDNPDTAASPDATCVRLTFGPRLGGDKLSNPASGTVVPGQRIDYTVDLSNSGNRNETLTITDTLPAGVTGFVLDQQPGSSTPISVMFTGGILTITNVTLAPGVATQLRFHVFVDANAADGLVIQNAAQVQVAQDPAQNTTFTAPALTVRNRPDLSTMTKTVVNTSGGGIFKPGDPIRYTITIPNTGNRDATSVVVRDVIDPSLTMVVADAGGTFDAATRAVTWNLRTIAAGQAVTVHIDARIVNPLLNGTVVSNQAFATATQIPVPGTPSDDPATAAIDDPTRFVVQSAPDFSAMTKTVSDVTNPAGPIRPGDTLRYAINLRNEGNSASTNTRVVDAIDPSLTNIQIVTGSGTFDSGTRTITWTLGAMAPGDSALLVFTARIVTPLANGTVISNQAFVVSDQIAAPGTPSDDPTTTAIDDPTRVAVTSAPNLDGSRKTMLDENGAPLRPGDFVTYTITLVNSGDAVARNVVVTDVVDTNLTAIQPMDGGTLAARTITWNLTAVDPSQPPVQVHFRAQIVRPLTNGTQICNSAHIASGAIVVNTAPVCGTVVSAPFFDQNAKSVSGDTGGVVGPGQTLTYTIRLHNSGDESAVNVLVTDVIDANLDQVTPLDGGTFNAATRTITWNVAQVSPLADVLLHFTARVVQTAPDGAIISNQAVITAGNTTSTTVTNRVDVRVSAVPNLTFTKTVTDARGLPAAPGDALTYTLSVHNNGPAFAFNVIITDPVDFTHLDNVMAQNGGTIAGSLITWRIPQIAAGDTANVTFTASIHIPTPNGTRISNQGSVVADHLTTPVPSDDPTTPAPRDPTVVTVVSQARLRAQKKGVELKGGVVLPGDVLEYTIKVTNIGTADAMDARVVDPIPPLTTLVPGSVRLSGAPQPDASLAAGLALGNLLVGETHSVIVTFRVTVAASAPAGAIIGNQALLSAQNAPPAVSDDPRTPEANDPTQVVVGGGVAIVAQKTFDAQPVGDNGNGVFDVGEQIQYRVRLTNVGGQPATGVRLDDTLPANTTYVSGTLLLQGAPLTDAADGDAGEVTGAAVHVRAGTINAGETATVTFRVRINAGPQVINQGVVDAPAIAPTPTDADGNPANGYQPTVTPVGADIAIDKTVFDINGGSVQPGDELLYTLTFHNTGAAPRSIGFFDDLPGGVTLVAGSIIAPPGSSVGGVPNRVAGTITVPAAGDAIVSFRVRVDGQLKAGTMVCNNATATQRSNDACFVVGAGIGQGALRGRVFQNLVGGPGFDDGDLALGGFDIEAFSAEAPNASAVARATAAGDGTYVMADLPPGDYILRAFSETGTQFAQTGAVSIRAGMQLSRDILVDPSGRIYVSTTGDLVAGATVSILYDDTGQPVEPEHLGIRQQNQRTGGFGMYRFDVQGGHKYRVVVDPPLAYSFPSTTIKPQDGYAGPGPVVPEAIPRPQQANANLKYFLKFDVAPQQADVTNNHIPLDSVGQLIHLDKRADVARASVGDIITYTLVLSNGSPRDLNGTGIRDILPTGLAFVRGNARIAIHNPEQSVAPRPLDVAARTPLDFGPFDLRAGGTATIVYQAVVGLDTREGIYENIADAYLQNVPLPGVEARARVRVVNDPIFDQGLLFGRVFCDRDGDGKPGPDEEGVFGARVYLDNGWYAVTDETGKYHLKDISPGVHLAKIDAATVTGTISGDDSQIIWFTRGLPAKANFAVRCTDVDLAPNQVKPKAAQGPAPPKTRKFHVTGDLDAWMLQIDGMGVPLPHVKISGPQTLAAPGPVSFQVESSRADAWTLRVGKAELSGRGTPPEQIDWDGKGLEAGKAYTYQIEIARLGAQASSAIGAFSVGGGPQFALERRIQGFTTSGSFTAAGKRALQTLAAEIPNGADVQIDAHTESRGGAVHAMATTATMARAAKELLVASGLAPERIHTHALGNSKPIVPGISPRARAQNRRLEIKVTRPPTPAPPATAPTRIAEAQVAGKVMPHRFATDVELPAEGRAVIEMQRADGSRVLIPIGKPAASTRAPMTSDVEGDLGRQRATVFGRPLLLDLLRVDLKAPSEVALGTPVKFTLAQPLAQPARWMLVVRRDDGEPAWRESGQGAPPSELMWAADNAAAGRTYYAQLLVDDGNGGRGSSPERTIHFASAKLAESQVSGRIFTNAGAPTLKLLAFVAQFKGQKVHAVVRLPRNVLVATARAATVRKALLAGGATAAEVRGTVGRGQPMVSVSAETQIAPQTQPVARVVVGGRDAPVDASGHFQLHATETPGAPVVLDVTDAEGRRAVYIVQPPVATAPAKKVQTTEEGTVVTGAQPRAARLRVHLPPRGITLGAPELGVRGSTDPKNKLTINGREVIVRSDGTFAELVPLAYGASVVEIRSVDLDGNTAVIRYPVEVKDTHFFLLALGDVAYSQAWDASGKLDPDAARLDGMTDETTLQTDSFLLHGRAALYLKARIHGGALAKYLDITAHADSAKRSELEDFIAQVVDPARFYPVYGDAALEVQDVRARDKLYLSIETDDKKDRLLVGNFRSQTKGLELFNYDRALYGGEIDVEKQIEHTNTKVKAFVSQDDGRLAKDHDVFRSTGGSIYFLRHQQLVPGGEHAQIVVRDRDSGMPLLTQPLARDSDYVIDYNGGRLFLKAPIPSIADASFLAGNFTATTSTLQGHPVYIEIDYDYQTDGITTGTVWGAQLHETFAGHITIGGGYVSEGREGADYKLWGVDSTLQLGKKSTFRAEFARSQSTDAGNFLSNDGGLSFYGLNGICPSLRACNPNADHDAYKFELTIVPGDWTHLGDDDLRGRGYIQVLDRGFYSSGSILEQGRTKYGGEIQWKLTPNDRILLRHDGSIAELPQLSQALGADPSGTAKLETELTTLQYAGGRGRWSWKGEYDHQFMQNSGPFTDASQRLGPEINRDSVAAAGAYKLTSRWTLRAGQEVVLHTSNDAQAPDPQIGSFDDHRFATTTIGFDYKLPSLGDTTASATGALRWNGDASLLFGLKTHISPTASVYANERLESVEIGSNWTSIVGAEDRFGDQKTGRTYGEYQLQSGASGQLNRALLGLTNRWEPLRGISFNGGYEHQHSFGASLPDGTPLGDQQRDVLSLGYQILRSERFKLGGRFELRFDDIGGNLSSTPCLGNAQADPRYSPCSNTLQPTPTSGPQSGLFADRTTLPGSQLMLSPGKKLEWFTTHTGEWQWHQDLTFLGRFTLLQVDDQTYNRLEARLVELTSGLAYRPLRLDWFNLIFKYTKLLELRPTGVSSGLHTDRHSDVVTLIPIFELPLRLQLVEKVAFKHIDQTDDVAFDPLDPSLTGQLHARTDLVLWINRVNAHVTPKLDAGIEYRVLKLWLPGDAEQTRHGMLVEVNYAVQRFVRLGVGFNFSRFGDNELLDPTVDAFGFFVRVVGRY